MAENKTITLGQLRKLALRGKANSDALIAELAELVAAGLEDAQHLGITVTLPCANWNGRAQVVSDPSLLANSSYWYVVCGDADCYMECCDAGVRADNVTVDGQMTFRCEVPPEIDLTVNIIRLEVDTNEQQP